MRNFFVTLACLLLFLPGAIAQTPGADGIAANGGMVFVSPHRDDEGLSYSEAITRIGSPRHQAFLKVMEEIHHAIGLRPSHVINGAGMYQHAGENTSAIIYPTGSSIAAMRAAAAALGYVANQKQVLVIVPRSNGEHAIHYLEIPAGKMRQAFTVAEKNLTAYTLLPDKTNPDKGLLIICENQYSGSLSQAAARIAKELGISRQSVLGTVEFLGDPDDRTKAGKILKQEAETFPAFATGSGGRQDNDLRRNDGEGGLSRGRSGNHLDEWRARLNAASPRKWQPDKRQETAIKLISSFF